MDPLLPSLFLSHGAPDLAISDHAAAAFLCGLSASLPRPKGIVICSAHWITPGLRMTGDGTLDTIHDFAGFPPALYRIDYPARGESWIREALETALAVAGFSVSVESSRGLDHGAWVPLMLAFPQAEVPVVQLSLDGRLDGTGQLAVGRALAPLRAAGILVIGSGASVHNLRTMAPEGTPVPTWAQAFEDWTDEQLSLGELGRLAAFQDEAPYARLAHPTVEHFLPLLFAAGAGDRAGSGAVTTGRRLHRSFSYGSLGMSAWAFD